MQRRGSPTTLERITASRMGVGAIEGLLAGKKNVMVGIMNGVVVYTPLKETIKKNSLTSIFLRPLIFYQVCNIL